LHNCRVIDTVDNNLFDSSSLEFFLFLKVSWNLLVGSRRSECSWEANDDYVLSSTIVGDVDLFCAREN